MRSTTVRVAAPPRVVFDYLAEPRHRPQWQSSLRAVDLLTDGPARVGTQWLDRTVVGAAPRLTIIAMTPPADVAGVWTEVGRWRGLTASLTLTFAAVPGDPRAADEPSAAEHGATHEPGATDVTASLDITGLGAWAVLARALRLLAPAAVRADLRRAAQILAAGNAPG